MVGIKQQSEGRGENRKKVRCDYFDYLDGKPGALNLYHGVYMSQYDWAQGHNLGAGKI